MRSPAGFTLALSLAVACTDDVTFADDPSASATDEVGTSSTSATSTDSTDATITSETSTTDETGDPPPVCGDGVLDPGEACDDGNAIDDDGCSNACESACGTQGWLDVTIPDGWFDIQQIAATSEHELVALGDVEIDGQPGRLRSVRVAEDHVIDAIESVPLGPLGTPELPQTHRIDAIARTPGGEALLVLGTSTEVLVVDEPPIERTWLAHFEGELLIEQWRIELSVDEPELRPVGLAVLANGDAIVTRTIEVAANDRDLGFERRSLADGSVVWTSSFSGPLEAGWSLDRAGLVAVGGERVWAAGIVRIDWQTYETTLIELDPSNGAILWSDVPLPDSGKTHEQRLVSLAAGPGGTLAVGIDVLGPSTPYDFGAAYGYVERELVWELRPEDLVWETGDPYITPQLAVDDDGEVLVVGRYTHDFGTNTAPRPWVVTMAPDGTMLCAAQIGEANLAALVPAVGLFGGGRGAVNLDTFGPGGMGPRSGGNWIAVLRGG